MMADADGSLRPNASSPISADEIGHLFSAFLSRTHILLAVSGGADSMAMMVLARDWANSIGRTAPRFSVATVDHGLRPESADEAKLVAKQAKAIRMTHTTLVWRGPKPKSGLQEKARAARFDLLISHAHTIGADAIAFAHHADDQAETILMRLASGSGLAGLSGMKPVSIRDGMMVMRPLLELPATRLRATLLERKIMFADDPSNENENFARVRLRHARDVLAAEGLSRDRLTRLAQRMARADFALCQFAAAAERRYRIPTESGVMFASGLFGEPVEVVLRIIGAAIAELAEGHEPILYRLENCISELLDAHSRSNSIKLTLGGTILQLLADGRLKIKPESRRRKV